MNAKTSPQGRKYFWNILSDELAKSSFLLVILAVFSGLILGGIVIILTTQEVYTAFGISFIDGIKITFNAVIKTYSSMLIGAFGDPAKIISAFQSGDAKSIRDAINPFFESLVTSTPFIFSGLSLALGFQVGLFNIGAEGQIYIGAIMGAWAGFAIKGLPPIIHVPLALGIGALGGALWGFIPGWLKAKTGSHEVINTIMMNYIAFNLVDYLLTGPLKDPKSYDPKTPIIQQSAHLFRFFEEPIRFHLGFFIAIGLAFLVWYLLFKTKWGFEMRTVGLNPNAARYAGINITRIIIISMSLSGALAGLAGANEILGVSYRLLPSFSSGYGFDAIALALLGKSHPFGVVLAALLFGFMRSGSRLMQLRAGIPVDIISIIQAFILIFIAAPAIIRTIYRIKKSPKMTESSIIGS